jgi:hypothetical protein
VFERESLGLVVSHFLDGDDRLARLRWTEAKSLERAPYSSRTCVTGFLCSTPELDRHAAVEADAEAD